MDGLASDVPGLIGGQIGHRTCNIFRLTQAAKGYFCKDFFLYCLRQVTRHISINVSRRHTVYRDEAGCQFPGG